MTTVAKACHATIASVGAMCCGPLAPDMTLLVQCMVGAMVCAMVGPLGTGPQATGMLMSMKVSCNST